MNTDLQPIPGSIVKAICAVMTTLEAVKKSQHNKHGGYNFASTDDIYAAITKKMGEVGLVCLALEDGKPEIERFPDKDGTPKPWMKAAYLFILATEDATWSDPNSRRSIFIQITGPQTFQAAQSYCEKSYLRSLFKIPTGDMDLDSLPEGFEYNSVSFSGKAAASSQKAPAAPPVPPPPPVPAPNGKAASAKPMPLPTPEALLTRIEDDLAVAQDEETLAENWTRLEVQMEDILTRNQREEAIDIYRKHEARVRGDMVGVMP